MAGGEIVKQICKNCDGTGQMLTVNGDPPGLSYIDCLYCEATGEVPWAVVDPVLTRTHLIIENTDTTEYNALSDANKSAYLMVIACGKVDLTDGMEIRTKLWNMFDDQSTTRANIITLLGE